MSDLQRATDELEALHAFFVAWFSGSVAAEDAVFAQGLTDRLGDNFVIVQPGGAILSADGIAHGIRSAYGQSPDFRIAIRNVRVARREGDVLVVLYEEWQVNARNSTPPNNGRVSTVMFRDETTRLSWLHVHETWLPPELMRAGPYDF